MFDNEQNGKPTIEAKSPKLSNINCVSIEQFVKFLDSIEINKKKKKEGIYEIVGFCLSQRFIYLIITLIYRAL